MHILNKPCFKILLGALMSKSYHRQYLKAIMSPNNV